MTPAGIKYIDQFLPHYARFDAIGTHVSHIQKLLRARGYDSEVFTEFTREETRAVSQPMVAHNQRRDRQAVMIYHHSTTADMPYYLTHCPGYRVVDYHNITPPEYFDAYGELAASRSCREGLLQLDQLALGVDGAWADSYHNACDLHDVGISDTDVLPILRDYKHLSSLASSTDLLARLKADDVLNLIFVGRINPNKCQHELLYLLRTLKSAQPRRCRLILVGGILPTYGAHIQKVAADLALTLATSKDQPGAFAADILLPGQLSDEEMAACYRASDYFVCLSDHEGFCVPLVEAMFFGLPIVAHSATVIPETLGQGGLLIDKHHRRDFLADFLGLVQDSARTTVLKERALARAYDFAWPKLEARFDEVLAQTISRASAGGARA